MKKVFSKTTLIYVQFAFLLYMMTVVGYNELNDNLGLIMATNTEFFLIISGMIVLILFGLEFMHSLSWIRGIALLIMVTTSIMMIPEGLSQVNATIWLFSIIYTVMVLITYIMILLRESKNKDRVNIKKEKTLPINHVSEKEYKKMMLIYASMVIFSLILIFFWNLVVKENYYIAIIIAFVVCFIVFCITAVKVNSLLKTIHAFNASAYFEKFKTETDSYLSEKLHPDMKSYIQVQQINAMFTVDKEKALKLFKNITPPKFKAYRVIYDLVEVYYHINNNDEKSARQCLASLKPNYMNKKLIDNIKMILDINFTEKQLDDVEIIFDINQSNLMFTKINNASALMEYYHTRHHREQAFKYAELILEYDCDLDEIKKQANKILNETR